MKNRRELGMIIISIVAIITIVLSFNVELVIPAGYDLAIDGIVISKTLMVLFALYLFSKIGFQLVKKD